MDNEHPKDHFLRAYDAYADELFRYCYYRVYERERAKELTQEIFMKIWEYLSAGKEIRSMRAFLYTIARNLIIDESKKKRTESLDKMSEMGWEPFHREEARWKNSLDADRVMKMIQRLSPKYREVVAMRWINDMSPRQIATLVKQSENAVSVRIHRGMAKLKKMLRHGEKESFS